MIIKSTILFVWLATQFFCVVAFSTQRLQIMRREEVPEVQWSCLFMTADDRTIEATMFEESPSSTVLSDASQGLSQNKSQLRHYQEKAAPIATSFIPTPYRPLPLLTNTHLQTIGGVFFRDLDDCAYVTNVAATVKSVIQSALDRKEDDEDWFWDERQRIDTPDGDFYHVDYKYAKTNSNEGTIVLLHGLQSNSNSSLSIDLANAYHHQLGMNVACMNFRGCSGVPNDKIGGYHLGFTDDLIHFLSQLKTNGYSSRKKPVYISGVSLGGNVVLKALGELGEDALTKYHIHGAAVAGVPFDHERNCRFQNSKAFTRKVYINNFVRSLQDRTQQQLELHCDGDEETDAFDYRRAMAAETNYEWEDAVIAPVYGFSDYIDYYRQTSCIRFLDYIAVPTLIINAEDDPLFDPSVFPEEKSVEGGGDAPLKMVRTKHGGHLGYIFHQPEQDEYAEVGRVASWMPTELARFVEHAHNHPHQNDRGAQ